MNLVSFGILQEKMELVGIYLILATTIVVQGYRSKSANRIRDKI